MPWDADTYLQQVGLNALGYAVGELDGIAGKKTARAKSQWLSARAADLKPLQKADYLEPQREQGDRPAR